MTLLGPAWSNPGGNPHKFRLFYWPFAGRRVDVELFCEPRDMWVGLFVDRRHNGDDTARGYSLYRHIYLILVPCFPLHIWWCLE